MIRALTNRSGRYLLTAFWLAAAFSAFVPAQKKTPPPKDPLAAFEKAIGQGKLAETEKPLLAFALADPQNVRALELVGRLRVRQGRREEAAALYGRALRLDPNYAPARLNYGRLLLELGRPDDARAVLAPVAVADVKTPAGLLDLANVLALAGEFRKSLEAAEKLPLALKNADALAARARSLIGLGDRAGFETLLPLAKKQAARPDIALGFAEVLIDARLKTEARELLRAVAAAAPQNARALVLLAREEILAGEPDRAPALLDRAEKLAPQSAEVFFVRAVLANARNDVAAAVEMLEKAVAREPSSTNLLGQLAVAAMRAGTPRKAVEAAEKLLAAAPDNPDFLYLYGAASLQSGSLDRAQTALERFMQLRPADSRGCLALGLTLAAQRDRIEPARRQLERCLEINPANYEAKYQLGLSYKAQGDTAAAIRYLEETTALAPNYALALRDLGAVYLQAGEERKARAALEKAVALNGADAETHFQLSRLYNLAGETELAKKHLEIFQRLRDPKTGGM